jgi:hypothetical protein
MTVVPPGSLPGITLPPERVKIRESFIRNSKRSYTASEIWHSRAAVCNRLPEHGAAALGFSLAMFSSGARVVQ